MQSVWRGDADWWTVGLGQPLPSRLRHPFANPLRRLLHNLHPKLRRSPPQNPFQTRSNSGRETVARGRRPIIGITFAAGQEHDGPLPPLAQGRMDRHRHRRGGLDRRRGRFHDPFGAEAQLRIRATRPPVRKTSRRRLPRRLPAAEAPPAEASGTSSPKAGGAANLWLPRCMDRCHRSRRGGDLARKDRAARPFQANRSRTS